MERDEEAPAKARKKSWASPAGSSFGFGKPKDEVEDWLGVVSEMNFNCGPTAMAFKDVAVRLDQTEAISVSDAASVVSHLRTEPGSL